MRPQSETKSSASNGAASGINHHHSHHGNNNLNTFENSMSISFHNSATFNSSQNVNILSAPKKAAVHDLTQVLIDDCQRVMTECHKLVSKYHTHLLLFANSNLNDSAHYRDELKTYRYQSYVYLKTSLDKILVQMDQVNVNESELSKYVQQIITYLEYLKYEFTRHFYLITSFSMQSEAVLARKTGIFERPDSAQLFPQKSEPFEIQKDLKEIQTVIDRLTQKYFILIPDFGDTKLTSKKDGGFVSSRNSYSCPLFTKCRFICCFCSPRYI